MSHGGRSVFGLFVERVIVFKKYTTEVLLLTHARLEIGVQRAIDLFISKGKKSGYAPDSYHLCLAMLAEVEDELFSHGIDPHVKKEQ